MKKIRHYKLLFTAVTLSLAAISGFAAPVSPSAPAVKASAGSVPIYFPTYGLNVNTNALTTLMNTDHINQIFYGTLLLGSSQCTESNLDDATGAQSTPNPITRQRKELQAYESAGGQIELTFGGATNGKLFDPTISCNDGGSYDGVDLANLIKDTITQVNSVSQSSNGSTTGIVAGIDFDIENNMLPGDSSEDNAQFWTNLGKAIVLVKQSYPNLSITLTIPQYYTSTADLNWGYGYNDAMRNFFKTYAADITRFNVLINGIPQSQYQQVTTDSLTHSGYQGKAFMITSADSPSIKFTQPLKLSTSNFTYQGASIFSASDVNGGRNCTAINSFEALNSAANQNTCTTGPGPGPGPSPTPGKGGLTVKYNSGGWSQLACWSNHASQVVIGLGQSGIVPDSAPVGSDTTATCSAAKGQPTFKFQNNRWVVNSTPAGMKTSCDNNNTCTVG